MGLFELNHNNLTGNTVQVGDLVISWDAPEDDTQNDTPGNRPEALETDPSSDAHPSQT